MPEPSAARLLIVDDEVAQMKALCHTLADAGYHTTGFSDAREALATLQQEKFDLLLTDLTMPDLDGISLLRAAQETDPHLVSVVMTGHATVGSAVEAMKAGALDYLLKPFNLSAARPVLERALAMRRLRLENARLQERVHQRTAELEAANEELNAFVYSVSHDLRAPLRGIGGYSHILAQRYASQLPEEAGTLLQSIGRGVRNMARLIEDLLNFSRFSRHPLQTRTVNMVSLVEEVLQSLRQEQPERPVQVRIEPLPDCPGDARLLKQVWINLLSNAWKFTRRKTPAIIEVASQRSEKEIIYLVRDNGAGFDMRYAEKLFGVFRRLHRADDFEGTGIGLSIVQRIIRRHGGRIWAEAKVDEGATFFFALPATA